MAYIESHEGRRLNVYIDTNGNKTIGIGHKVDDDMVAITDFKCDDLFEEDIPKHLKRAKRIFPRFDSYPLYVRAALLDGVFRGDLSGSPKTIRLINLGKWIEASEEYLNNKEYKKSVQNQSGVFKRMLENSSHFECYGKELSLKS